MSASSCTRAASCALAVLFGGTLLAQPAPGGAAAPSAQPPPAGAVPGSSSAPPVLSTVPTTPAGVPFQPASMSGLPLQVGDLPPGTVAVRVVRPPFVNVTGQTVELRIGAEGRSTTAVTGSDGRAQFNGLRVGDHVIAVAVVDGERLASQLFELPAMGGVRVLLATGQPGAAPAAAPSDAASPVPEPSTEGTGSKAAFVLVFLCAAVGIVVWRSAVKRVRRPPAPPAEVADRSALVRRRDRLYEELVALELVVERGGPPDPLLATKRETLMGQLEEVYAALDDTDGAPPPTSSAPSFARRDSLAG